MRNDPTKVVLGSLGQLFNALGMLYLLCGGNDLRD
jgi:hypothetical protein